MSFDLGIHGSLLGQGEPCRLVIRKEKSLSEILQFSIAGLEIGQQVVIMAGPTCLKDIAHGLSETGLKTDALLHSGRLVFLTAPNCLAELLRPSEPLQRSPLHRHATVMRWVTDWSWVYGNGSDAATIRDYQRRLHEFIRPFNAISMCTVLCEKVQRGDLLAMLVRPPAGSENRRSNPARCGRPRLARQEKRFGGCPRGRTAGTRRVVVFLSHPDFSKFAITASHSNT